MLSSQKDFHLVFGLYSAQFVIRNILHTGMRYRTAHAAVQSTPLVLISSVVGRKLCSKQYGRLDSTEHAEVPAMHQRGVRLEQAVALWQLAPRACCS